MPGGAWSRSHLLAAAVVALLGAALLLVHLDRPPLHTDEITYMSAALQSMQDGTVLPTAGGRPFMNKPPLALWLIRLAFTVLGPSTFAARLPSALAGVATAILVLLFGSRRFGLAVGLPASLLFLCIPGLLEVHGLRAATPDALEILLVTLAIVAIEAWRRTARPWALVVAVAAATASTWVKSPFAMAVILVYLLATEPFIRRAGGRTPRPILTVSLLLVTPLAAFAAWVEILIHEVNQRLVVKFLLKQQYGWRIAGELSKGHVHGQDYYPQVLLADFGPLLFLAVLALLAFAIVPRLRSAENRYALATLLGWSLVAPVLASFSVSKLSWYLALSYPGIALLIAWSAGLLAAARAEAPSAALRWGGAVLVLVLVGWQARLLATEPERAQSGPERLAGVVDRQHASVAQDAGFRFPRPIDEPARAERLFVRALIWQGRPEAAPRASCRATLTNEPASGAPQQMVNLVPPKHGQQTPIFVRDECAGTIARALAVD